MADEKQGGSEEQKKPETIPAAKTPRPEPSDKSASTSSQEFSRGSGAKEGK